MEKNGRVLGNSSSFQALEKSRLRRAQISFSLLFDCELKRTNHEASPVSVFVPNPSLS